MLRLDQIICANKFIRKFQLIAKSLNQNPGAYLATRRTGEHFVFANARLYQELLENLIHMSEQGLLYRDAYDAVEET